MPGAGNPIDVAASLLAGVAASSETDFARLFETYALRVRARLMARGLGARRPDLDDATQEVFLRVWRQRGTYRPTGSGAAYLMSVANHVAAEWRRREWRRAAREHSRENQPKNAGGRDGAADAACAEDGVGYTAAEGPAIARETAEHVRAALARLPEKERQAVQLCWIDGTPGRLAADLLHCSLNALKKRLRQSRRHLRDALAPRSPTTLTCPTPSPAREL